MPNHQQGPFVIKSLSKTLIVQFSVVSFAIMAIIAVLLAVVLTEKIRSDAIDNLVDETVGSSTIRVLAALTLDDLEVAMTGERYDRFHKFVQDFVVSERTARIKLWAGDGTIIYSNDPNQVGQRFPNKENLEKALAAKTAIEIKIPEDADNQRERHLGTLVEVYVPIVSPGQQTPLEYLRYTSITHPRPTTSLACEIGFLAASEWDLPCYIWDWCSLSGADGRP
jgi:hypothetical protein